MDLMRLEAENSAKEVTVASIRNPDKFTALDTVLEAPVFFPHHQCMAGFRKTSVRLRHRHQAQLHVCLQQKRSHNVHRSGAGGALVGELRNRGGFANMP
jgi:anti-sigma factor ChrR (cupin superfamily)